MRVVFDPEHFKEAFGEIDFTNLTLGALQMYWEIAVSYVGDDDSNSFAPYDPDQGIIERRLLLELAMAHQILYAQLNASSGGLSGRVTSATEGSVTVAVEPLRADSLNAQYWTQTAPGTQYWMLTAKYRLGGRLFCHKEAHPFG